MGFSLTDLFVSALLLGNAGAVLNEDRFLVKLGWGYEQSRNAGPSVKKDSMDSCFGKSWWSAGKYFTASCTAAAARRSVSPSLGLSI